MIVQWRKSSYSGSSDDDVCVELGRLMQGIGVRDSKNPKGGHLALTLAEFTALVDEVKRLPVR